MGVFCFCLQYGIYLFGIDSYVSKNVIDVLSLCDISKKVKIFFVIHLTLAECGFLSNYEEAEKLTTSAYQKKVAKVLCTGMFKGFGFTRVESFFSVQKKPWILSLCKLQKLNQCMKNFLAFWPLFSV